MNEKISTQESFIKDLSRQVIELKSEVSMLKENKLHELDKHALTMDHRTPILSPKARSKKEIKKHKAQISTPNRYTTGGGWS